jgi:hypothetical protein
MHRVALYKTNYPPVLSIVPLILHASSWNRQCEEQEFSSKSDYDDLKLYFTNLDLKNCFTGARGLAPHIRNQILGLVAL